MTPSLLICVRRAYMPYLLSHFPYSFHFFRLCARLCPIITLDSAPAHRHLVTRSSPLGWTVAIVHTSQRLVIQSVLYTHWTRRPRIAGPVPTVSYITPYITPPTSSRLVSFRPSSSYPPTDRYQPCLRIHYVPVMLAHESQYNRAPFYCSTGRLACSAN